MGIQKETGFKGYVALIFNCVNGARELEIQRFFLEKNMRIRNKNQREKKTLDRNENNFHLGPDINENKLTDDC